MDHAPSADELLQQRLGRGWTPTPTIDELHGVIEIWLPPL